MCVCVGVCTCFHTLDTLCRCMHVLLICREHVQLTALSYIGIYVGFVSVTCAADVDLNTRPLCVCVEYIFLMEGCFVLAGE